MNIQEQIDAFKLKLQEIGARKEVIMTKAADEGRTLEDDESSEYDGLDTELKAVSDHLKRLEGMLASQGETATDVAKQDSVTSKTKFPEVHIKTQDKDDDFQGQSFTRRVIAKAVAHMSDGEKTPGMVAEERWGKSNPKLVEVIKAAVGGGSSGTPDWGNELVSADNRFTGDFLEYLAGMTIYDQLSLRTVPANVSIKGQDGIGTGYWVGESKSIPVSAQSFNDVQLTPLKVAAISVLSNELIRDSSPSAEALVRDGLIESTAQRVDSTFLGAGAGVAGVEPAGLLNGVTGLLTNGPTADGLRQDINALYAPFIAALHARGIQLVMNTALGKSIGLMVNALGQIEFAGMGANGGTLLGDTAVTGDNVGATHLIAIDPSNVWRIGDGGIQVSLSREATIAQDDAPAADSDTPTQAGVGEALVSMFQTESTAFKIVRPLNFAKRRPSAVAYVSDAAYAP